MRLGSDLIDLLQTAREEVIVAAPFIKQGALRRVLAAVPAGVTITVVVRFLPADLAAGVTDKGIVKDVLAHPQANLFMQPALHAKLYRADEWALVGSANLTGRALGWSNTPNLELLVGVGKENPQVQRFERVLRATAVTLTQELADIIVESAPSESGLSNPELINEKVSDENIWIPGCMRPEILWQVQTSGDSSYAISSVVRSAERDISLLGLPQGLPKEVFDATVRAIFLSSPFYEELIEKLEGSGLPDEEAIRWLAECYEDFLPSDPRDTWYAIKNWLRRYGEGVRIEAESERTRLAESIGRYR